jgi:hypothetical protein
MPPAGKSLIKSICKHGETIAQHLAASFGKLTSRINAAQKELIASKQLGAEYAQYWSAIQDVLDKLLIFPLLKVLVRSCHDWLVCQRPVLRGLD